MTNFKNNKNLRFSETQLPTEAIREMYKERINNLLLDIKGDTLGDVKIYHVIEEDDDTLNTYEYLEVYESGLQITKIITDDKFLEALHIETIVLGRL